VGPAAPVESLVFERTVLKPGLIELHVRNTSPQELAIAQIDIRDAFVPSSVSPDRVVPRLARAVIRIPCPWVQAEQYGIRLFSSNSIPFETTIEAAAQTRAADPATLGGFTLIGIYVGVIPVFLGIFWYPALRRLGRSAGHRPSRAPGREACCTPRSWPCCSFLLAPARCSRWPTRSAG
jgi:hypothetical protein